MKEFTMQHKLCGMIRTIEGNDIWDAMRKNNLCHKFWEEI